jgi:hypothetical protein
LIKTIRKNSLKQKFFENDVIRMTSEFDVTSVKSRTWKMQSIELEKKINLFDGDAPKDYNKRKTLYYLFTY